MSLLGLKIIFVFLGGEFGGAERQGLQLANHMKVTLGADVRVWGLMADQPGRVAEICAGLEIPWHKVPFHWSGKRSERISALFRLALLLRKENPDILLPFTWLPNVACGLTWRISGARLCVWNQRDEGRDLNTGFWHRAAVKLTPAFVANAGIGKEFLEKTYGRSAGCCEIIHNGIVLTPPQSGRAVYRKIHGIQDACFVACMIGNLHRYKDHVTLLKAWSIFLTRLSNQDPLPVLLLAGRFDEMELHLKALVAELNLAGNVKFLGHERDISGLLQASDLYVHSSKTEGLANGILEAMASALPIVATDISGNREALGDDAVNSLVPLGDADGLATKVFEFFHDPELRADSGRRNLDRAKSEFGSEIMCDKYVALLQAYCNKAMGEQ